MAELWNPSTPPMAPVTPSQCRAGGVEPHHPIGMTSSTRSFSPRRGDVADPVGAVGWGQPRAEARSRLMSRPFQGVINIDIRDSVPDWAPYLQPVAPEGAPNIVYIVL